MTRTSRLLSATAIACASIGGATAFAATGDRDDGYGIGGTFRVEADGASFQDVALRSNGQLVAAGGANFDDPAQHDGFLAQTTSGGLLDTTFGVIGTVGEQLFGATPAPTEYRALAVRPTGEIVVAGFRDSTIEQFVVAQYTAAGALNTTGFHNPDGGITYTFYGGADQQANDVALAADGDAVAVGYVDHVSANGENFAVARTTPTGAFDNTFGGGDGMLDTFASSSANGEDRANAVAIDPSDGDIVAAGVGDLDTADDEGVVTRYASNGAPDAGFGGGDGKLQFDLIPTENDSVTDVAIQPDGKIVIVGNTIGGSDFDHFVARLEPDGDFDPTFGDGGDGSTISDQGGINQLSALTILSDGRIVAVGRIGNEILTERYTTAGLPDASYDGDGAKTVDVGVNAAQANSVLAQPDGKLVLGGSIGNDALIVRLAADDPPVVTPPTTPPPPAAPKCKKGQKLKKGKCVKKKRKKR